MLVIDTATGTHLATARVTLSADYQKICFALNPRGEGISHEIGSFKKDDLLSGKVWVLPKVVAMFREAATVTFERN